jgi:hypothetical protein
MIARFDAIEELAADSLAAGGSTQSTNRHGEWGQL